MVKDEIDPSKQKSIEAELESYVDGKDSTLSKLVGTGDIQGLGRFTKAIGETLNSASRENSVNEISGTLEQEKKKKREQVTEMHALIKFSRNKTYP